METAHVNVSISELQLGKIIAEDIFANTQYPVIFKDTKVDYDHFHILKAFNVHKIPILVTPTTQKVDSEGNIRQEEVPVEDTVSKATINSFEKYYKEAVDSFKREFYNWQSGARVDIPKIRHMMIPLIERILETRSYIFDLNMYSSPSDYLYHHCIATGLISSIMAQKLGYERGICIQVAIAGTLADAGMSKVPAKIRNKQTKLTEHEFIEVKRHPIQSYSMVKDVTALKQEMKMAIFQHHERLNGSGYPKGERGDTISIYAQIIAVADVYHAMTSERLYSEKKAIFQVIEMIRESEFGKFDIKVVQALIDIVADVPIGTKVELSNKERAEVMFINKYAPTRPLIKIESTGEVIDLTTVRSYFISRVITK